VKDTTEVRQAIEQSWRSRATAQGVKPGSVASRRAEVEFFAGAMAAMQALFPNEDNPDAISKLVPPIWVINIMSGRPVVERT
jgi:hypothetical protein